jgi:DNA topoisomerase-3
MQLVIAEKPSVARDLARVLGVRATGRSSLEGPRQVITWCIGHLVELEEPAAYDARWKTWRFDTLPMIPGAFKLRPVPGTRDQLRAVRELLRDRRFTEVVNGCDAGREGELIFRYVYELAQSRLPVRRLWISSMTDEAIRQGFAGLRAGREYDGLADAARCRSEADWLVGMNATRAVTLRTRTFTGGSAARTGRGDRPAVYSIGRVQTPTLAILVRREQAIRAFRPKDYWEIRGTFTPASAGVDSFAALWTVRRAGETAGITRFAERSLAEDVRARADRHRAATDPDGPVVERLVQKRTREPPPLLFDLTSLQRTANRRFGFSATRTLEAAQALYERHKLLTYPRTDSRHLPPDQAAELPKLFAGLAKIDAYAPFVEPLLVQPPPRSRRIFDASKVQDHHAIIPTGKAPGAGLTSDEQRIFDLVARRFLAAFHPDAEFALTEAVVRVGAATATPPPPAPAAARGGDAPPAEAEGETMLTAAPPPPDRFVARGRVRLVAGWQTVAGLDDRKPNAKGGDRDRDHDRAQDHQEDATLPALAEGQRLDARFETLTRQTRPPARHSEATLLGAMESAGREIDDEALRAAMKDTGLGTPATRAATIETLVKRGFIARDGKVIVPTATGIALIEGLPVPTLASPELTGTWEARLARIARGQDSRAAFMKDIVQYVHEITEAVRTSAPPSAIATEAPAVAAAPSAKPARARGKRRADTSEAAAPAKRAPRALAKTPPAAPSPAPARAATPLPCPSCRQGTLIAGKRGWGCTRWREGCGFVIWFELDGRRLTDGQLRELVAKGKTRRATWSLAGRPPMAGRLILDLGASRDRGAARFEPS